MYDTDALLARLDTLIEALDRLTNAVNAGQMRTQARQRPTPAQQESKVDRDDYIRIITYLADPARSNKWLASGEIFKGLDDPDTYFAAKYVYGKCMALVREHVLDTYRTDKGKAMFRINEEWAREHIEFEPEQ